MIRSGKSQRNRRFNKSKTSNKIRVIAKKSDIKNILNPYEIKLNKNQQFYHILEEIKKHDYRLKKFFNTDNLINNGLLLEL